MKEEDQENFPIVLPANEDALVKELELPEVVGTNKLLQLLSNKEVQCKLSEEVEEDTAIRLRNDKILKQFQSFPEIRNIDCPKCFRAMAYVKNAVGHAHSGFDDAYDDSCMFSFACSHCGIGIVLIQKARWDG